VKKYRIVMHCSATAEDVDYTEEHLERDHKERGIRSPMGYHFYIRKSGEEIKGRNFNEMGAHALGYNKDSWGICYEGGLKPGGIDWRDAKDTRNMDQKAGELNCIYKTIEYINSIAEGEIKKDYVIEIIGHGQLPNVQRACPCYDAYKEFSWITA
jgi:N-acetylmuramoyl-L-alanine amidase